MVIRWSIQHSAYVRCTEMPFCHQPSSALLFPSSCTKKKIILIIAPRALGKSRLTQKLHPHQREHPQWKHSALSSWPWSCSSDMPVLSRGTHLPAGSLQIPETSEITSCRNLHATLLSWTWLKDPWLYTKFSWGHQESGKRHQQVC